MSEQPQLIADLTARYLEPADRRRIGAWLRAGRWAAIREASSSFAPAMQDSVLLLALRWAGAFGLEREQAALISQRAHHAIGPDFWTADARGTLARMFAARDDGTGADPVLLAHLADRVGDTAQAESLLAEESWREFGPAMTYRLAQLYERTSRPTQALEAYQRFLKLWSGSDSDLPPVHVATEAVRRLNQ